jgi:hypothetical protein
MAVNNHHTLHEKCDDFTMFFLGIQVFWDITSCRWMLMSLLRNVAKHLSKDIASYPRRPKCSTLSSCPCP